MAERPTFSPFWHRVRALKPRLRPHVQVTRQHYRGRRWHVAHDPTTNQFFRLNPIGHELVGLLDGKRTVEEVWTILLQRHGDDSPTQQEALQLIGQLYSSNLLSVDAPPETEQLLRRGRERRKKKAMGQAVGLMYFKIRLFNPDGIFAWLEPLFRPILNRVGFFVWLALVLGAIIAILPHFDRLAASVDNTLAPANWGWLTVVFIVTKAIHEIGHGVVLRRFGGQVPEFGVMLLVLFPAPYVDATASWALESKWKRIAVGSGGMIFELFVAAIAAMVWLSTEPGALIHQIAYNAMFIASISTILFNANPLMRFDGYYILSDLLEVPNLMQRAQNMIKHFFKRYAFGIENDQPPTTNAGERRILVTYGILALAYRVFLFISITLFVMGKMFALGLLLAIWTGAMWFVLPVGKFVHWLASHPSLLDKRVRAVTATMLMLAIGVGSLGMVPFPDWRKASGVVEPARRSGVFFASDGFILEAFVSPGERVGAGDAIVTIDNPELRVELSTARAELARAEVRWRSALARSSPAADELAEAVMNLTERVAILENRIDRLTVRAPHDGVVAGADPSEFVGAWVQEGTAICEIVEDRGSRIVATLSQRENTWAIRHATGNLPVVASVRFLSDAGRSIEGNIVEVVESGQSRLAHASLGYAGGGTIATDPQDESGTMATSRQFELRIVPADGEPTGAPGERVRVRFTLPSRPLMAQWADRLHKLVQGRVTL